MFNLNLGKIALLQLRYPNKTNTKKKLTKGHKKDHKKDKKVKEERHDLGGFDPISAFSG